MIERNGSVELFFWNPRTVRLGSLFGRHVEVGPRKSNFGDLLGPMIVRRLVKKEGLGAGGSPAMLLTVGSVLHFGRPEAHVWGTGRNGKVESEPVPGMYIHALRGPLTARYLSSRYTTLPDTYGDPGLLVPYLFPEFTRPESPSRKIGVLANLNDKREPGDTFSVIEPTAPVDQVVRAILDCEYLVTSSLHGLIIAESFGVPVRHMRSDHEPRFKYEDYFEGTGRRMPPSAHNPMHALDLGPQDPVTFDPEPLLAAFPRHLWSRTASSKSNSKRGAAA